MFLGHPYWADLSIAKHYKSRVERESVGVCVETQGREYSVSEREYSSIMVLSVESLFCNPGLEILA